MNHDVQRVKGLLAALLSLDALGPSLRRAARQALASGDLRRMQAVGRLMVAELLRSGELVRVMVDRRSSLAGPVCLHRRSARLLDLAPLARPAPPGRPRFQRPGTRARRPSRATTVPLPGDTDLSSLDPVLAAMERAQNLGLGEPRSGEAPVILDNILDLLGHFLPQLQLFILLGKDLPVDEQTQRIFPADFGGGRPSWAAAREPGTSLWISSWGELPLILRHHLPPPTGGEDAAEPSFHGGVAVPLAQPAWGDPDPAHLGREVGLFFAIPRRPLPRENVLRVGRRLSRFVTQRWRHLREVNQRIHTDSLTGIHNRAFFDLQLGLELERAKRGSAPLTLVLADLDHFKDVNDRYGHQVGDQVLQRVAHELLAGLRRIDHVCRIGGEEFALILPETSFRAAQDAVTRLLTRMNQPPPPLSGVPEPVMVTLSFGAVTYPEAGSDPEELYRLADAMLYRSKRMGRNRCSVWNLHGEPTTLLPLPAAD